MTVRVAEPRLSSVMCATVSTLAILCYTASPAHGHAVTVDGTASEWTLAAPPFANMARVSRSGTGTGEFVWIDADSDVRTDLGTSSSTYDLLSVRVTGTSANLSFLVTKKPQVGGAPPIMLQVTIDTDQVSGSGQSVLAGFADVTTAPDLRWEYLLKTTFESTSEVVTLNSAFGEVGRDPAVMGLTGETIEFSIPWSRLGLGGPPATPLRMTLSSYAADLSGNTLDIGGPSVANALDAVGNCGDPKQSAYLNAWDCDLSDADLDYGIDVWFNPSGEVISPLLIGEVLDDPTAGVPEWVEVRNAVAAAVSLNGCKLGDEEQPDPTSGIEAMATFPNGLLIPSGQALSVAVNASQFLTAYGFKPSAEFTNSDGTVPDMVSYAAWFTGAPGTFVLANAGDHVLLLDRWDTVLDVLTYGVGAVYPGITAHAVVATGHSLERSPSTTDTDNCANDFIDQSSPNPENPTVGVAPGTVADRMLGPARPNPAVGQVEWTLVLPWGARTSATIHDATGRRVVRLLEQELSAGPHTLRWDGRDEGRRRLPSGRYYLRVEALGERSTGAVTILD